MARKSKTSDRRTARARRHGRVVKKVRGTAERPRLVVHRSLRNVEGQIVDDDRGRTLLGISTLTAGDASGIDDAEEMSPKLAASYAAGMALAKKARESGIERIVFDRGGYLYHGRIRAFAEGARAGGLDF
ncbi:MAG: 50S ribosomal protein L18 [Gemmatimonadota bacterium]